MPYSTLTRGSKKSWHVFRDGRIVAKVKVQRGEFVVVPTVRAFDLDTLEAVARLARLKQRLATGQFRRTPSGDLVLKSDRRWAKAARFS